MIRMHNVVGLRRGRSAHTANRARWGERMIGTAIGAHCDRWRGRPLRSGAIRRRGKSGPGHRAMRGSARPVRGDRGRSAGPEDRIERARRPGCRTMIGPSDGRQEAGGGGTRPRSGEAGEACRIRRRGRSDQPGPHPGPVRTTPRSRCVPRRPRTGPAGSPAVPSTRPPSRGAAPGASGAGRIGPPGRGARARSARGAEPDRSRR